MGQQISKEEEQQIYLQFSKLWKYIDWLAGGLGPEHKNK